MNKCVLAISGLFLLASCAPTSEELATKYTNAPESFEQLRQMIGTDIGKRACFAVGLDHIGDYWRYSGGWDHSGDYNTKLPLSGVLEAEGLSEERYNKCKRLFGTTGSEEIEFCQSGPMAPWVSVLVYRSGMAVSGCSATIEWRKPPPPPKQRRYEGDLLEISPLQNGWYLVYECT